MVDWFWFCTDTTFVSKLSMAGVAASTIVLLVIPDNSNDCDVVVDGGGCDTTTPNGNGDTCIGIFLATIVESNMVDDIVT